MSESLREDAPTLAGRIVAQAHVTASGEFWKALAFDLAKQVLADFNDPSGALRQFENAERMKVPHG